MLQIVIFHYKLTQISAPNQVSCWMRQPSFQQLKKNKKKTILFDFREKKKKKSRITGATTSRAESDKTPHSEMWEPPSRCRALTSLGAENNIRCDNSSLALGEGSNSAAELARLGVIWPHSVTLVPAYSLFKKSAHFRRWFPPFKTFELSFIPSPAEAFFFFPLLWLFNTLPCWT